MTNLTRRSALAALAALAATPAFANHPGENLDARMMEMEDYFQRIDEPSEPAFELQDAQGKLVRLSDYNDKIVVLYFIYAGCNDVCPLHSQKISEIQSAINEGPMKDMVQFIAITTDPANDTSEILQAYPEVHGLDTQNWVFLTTAAGQSEDATRRLAREYGLEFTMTEDTDMMMHAAVTHVIDIGGRFAGKFHGMNFKNVNLVLYVSELINNAQHRQRERGWFDWLTGAFR